MSVSTKHVLSQGPALRGMGEAALGALKQRLGLEKAAHGDVTLPGPEVRATFPPRSPELIRDYVRHVGGDPSSYKKRVPPHLFPQWGFALTGKTLAGLSYPMVKAMNGGCRLVQNAPLPSNEPLEVSARLVEIDDDGKRAILTQRIVTGTASSPEAVVADLFIFVPLAKPNGKGSGEKKDKARVPADAKEIAFFKLRADAGLDFAKLTGDFNPVHWIAPYAKAFGFRNTILHGFGTMARAIEGLNRGLFAGDVDAISEFHVRFTRPLVLPAKVGLYVKNDEVFVGDAPSGPAYLTG
ncbi:MAG TPA: MaoC/PaaZ C-terminal domain-containing protein, partial [Planctomycetota bacterium]|nr:MaoC/PaaZ C-terminal domain-containing protein [Planctomycetota bacterium]